jgi:PKD repeat protein
VVPVSNVIATKAGYNCLITWSASTETNVIGYNVYTKNDTNSTYVKLNTAPITGTTTTDNCLKYPGIYTYMVRALKLESTPSGTYYNMSEGISDTAYNSVSTVVTALFTTFVSGNNLYVANSSSNAANYLWNFGNTQTSTAFLPQTTYTANGSYTVSLIAYNPCDADTFVQVVNVCHWLANAAFQFSVNGNTATFSNASLNGSTYLWNFGNGITSAVTNPVITYTAPGTYTVSLITSNDCSGDTTYKVVTIKDVGLNETDLNSKLIIFPNPSEGKFKITSSLTGYIELTVFNCEGRKIYYKSKLSSNQEVDLSAFSKGIYFARIKTDEAFITRKLVLK